MAVETPDGADRAFHGRRKGKALRGAQLERLATVLPEIRVPDGAIDDPGVLFAHPTARIVMEIGFGGGEHLVAQARARPGDGFIGVEPFINGAAKALAAIERDKLTNIRIHDDDAAILLDRIGPATLDEIWLNYPDPWPKWRQRKRRFVSFERVMALARVLKPGGLFRFATDIDDYAGWTLARLLKSSDFSWVAQETADWLTPFPGWVETRYEAKAKAAGRAPTYLTFRRN